MANRSYARVMRRKVQWAGFGSASGTAALPRLGAMAAGTPIILSQGSVLGGALGFLDEEVTITRMIGQLTVGLNVDTALADATVAVGCLVVRNEALVAGVVSLPSPEDDPDSEWLYYVSTILVNPQSALRDGPTSSIVIAFDVRSQRILRAGWSVVWLAESEGNNAIAGVTGRYLAKLT